MFLIGDKYIDSPVLLAPMAGVTDLPFRKICREFGAGLTTSEMVTSDTRLWQSRKSASRLKVVPQSHPVSMQIAGSEPKQLAEAAVACQQAGAEIIDINMGCPAKKVCKKLAGSALLSDEALVYEILTTVVTAVDIPVTLKTRTGPDLRNINAETIGQMAESAGIKALALHGRTRACRFNGSAEHNTAKKLAERLAIPLITNGDIDSPQKANRVLEHTGASALMVGRAALGQPWIFREINSFLNTKKGITPESTNTISADEKHQVIVSHLKDIHQFYGEYMGVRIARKHAGWYCQYLPNGKKISKEFNRLESTKEQLQLIDIFFSHIKDCEDEAA